MPSRERFGMLLREHQARILDYPLHPGPLAVSAVPGSGKTQTLALLAAELIVDGHLGNDATRNAEVLVVTLQNSAVDQISARIRGILSGEKLPPVGFRVSTLHKLAGDILRQRQDLAGVDDTFAIVDEAESRRQMQAAASVWKTEHLAWWESFLPEGTTQERTKHAQKWDDETQAVGLAISKLSKHLRLGAEEVRSLLDRAGLDETEQASQWLRMGIDLYARYTNYLRVGARLDFDDLIWRAMDALEQDPAFVANLQLRWPFILEDEAQDSSPLQEKILRQLAGRQGRWVRVGDPNQAINSTFTSADPRFFRAYMERPDVERLPLVESGRSGLPIIGLANRLVDWVCSQHPDLTVRKATFERQEIKPTQPGDKQVNPSADECHVYLRARPYDSVEDEVEQVAKSAAAYAGRYPERTLAILCPSGWQGSQVLKACDEVKPTPPVDDLLNSTPKTRDVARTLYAVCRYLAAPMNGNHLAALYKVLADADREVGSPSVDAKVIRARQAVLRSLSPAHMLFPVQPGSIRDLLPPAVPLDNDADRSFGVFVSLVRHWVRASDLAIDQLLLTVAQDLFEDEGDLAVCHLIASSLGSAALMHPQWRLAEFEDELRQIASNRRSLGGLGLLDTGFSPQPGRIAVTTMHKAKGLEWDAVYIVCAATDEFPDAPDDAYRDELYFLPGCAPKVEATKALERIAYQHLPQDQAADLLLQQDALERTPLESARLEYISERLRLLYVGITRARRDLSITWSHHRNARRPLRWPLALQALEAYAREQQAEQDR